MIYKDTSVNTVHWHASGRKLYLTYRNIQYVILCGLQYVSQQNIIELTGFLG